MGILDAIGYVGDTVDKFTGSRALRGALAGKPRELLSPIPFSDRLGITQEEDSTSGRELTDRLGLTSKHDQGWGASAAGFGADMLLDPSNLLGGIGLHKLSKVAIHGDDVARASSHSDEIARAMDSVWPSRSTKGLDVSPSLGLKYDSIADPASVGLRRSDPDWINNKTFYHGTATPDLTGGSLDPLLTSGESLFGHGIYTTDDFGQPRPNKITKGYAKARLGVPLENWERSRDNYAARLASKIDRRRVRQGGAHLDLGVRDEIKDRLRQKYVSRNPPPKGIVYQGQSDFGKILDLDQVADDDIRDIAYQITHGQSDPRHWVDYGRVYMNPRSTAGDYVRAAKRADPFDLIRMLNEGGGYDALTHIGGRRTGNAPHQVVIGLDPKYKQWEKFLELSPDELADYSIDKPARHPASPTKHMAVQPWEGRFRPDITRDAIAYGPKYGYGVDRLRRALEGIKGGETGGGGTAGILLGSHESTLSQIADELPTNASPIGGGAEAAVFEAGPGHIIRVAPRVSQFLSSMSPGYLGHGRADIQEMLQPVRSINVGKFQVEHLPRITDMTRHGELEHLANMIVRQGSPGVDTARNLIQEIRSSTLRASDELNRSIISQGLRPVDIAPGHNVGIGNRGKILTYDPGAVVSPDALDPIVPPDLLRAPSKPGHARFMEKIKAPDEIRSAITEGLSAGSSGRGIDVPAAGKYVESVRKLRSILADAIFNGGIDPTRIPKDIPVGPMDILTDLAPSTPIYWAGQLSTPTRTPEPHSFDQTLRGLLGDLSVAEPPVSATATQGGYGDLSSRLRQFAGNTGAALKLSPQDFDRAAREIGATDPSIAAGLYSRGNDKIVMRQGQPSRVIREERGHSMVANAQKSGPKSIASLPLAWQPGAWAQYVGGNGTVGRLGRYLDEIAQHGTRERGLSNQLLGSLSYVTNPSIIPEYANHLASNSPVLAAIMATPVQAWQNRVPLGVAGIGAKNLAQLAAELRHQNAELH